jgi:hypothetical protein
MYSVPKLFVLAIALCAAASSAVGKGCGYQCKFTFCPNQGPLSLGQPDKALTGAICDKYGHIYVGHVDSTGEAYVEHYYGAKTPISLYQPQGLRQAFSPSFWKSYGFDYYHGKRVDLSGVGHETPQQNQADFLHGKCFILPLTAYQVLDSQYGNVIDNKHPTDPFVDCVAFTVY